MGLILKNGVFPGGFPFRALPVKFFSIIGLFTLFGVFNSSRGIFIKGVGNKNSGRYIFSGVNIFCGQGFFFPLFLGAAKPFFFKEVPDEVFTAFGGAIFTGVFRFLDAFFPGGGKKKVSWAIKTRDDLYRLPRGSYPLFLMGERRPFYHLGGSQRSLFLEQQAADMVVRLL